MIHINMETRHTAAALTELKANGFTYIASRAAPSWNGRPPEVLIIASIPDWSNSAASAVRRLADRHNQDCIAVRFSEGVGVTLGPKPVAYNEEYFQCE
jgi:hypothetical protein